MRRSSALRLTFWMCLIFALVLLLTGLTAYVYIREALERDIDTALEAQAILVADATYEALDEGDFDPEDLEDIGGEFDWAVQYRGRVVLHGLFDILEHENKRPEQALRGLPEGFSTRGDWRFFVAEDEELRFITAASVEDVEDNLEIMRNAVFVALSVGLLAAIAVGLWFGRRADLRFKALSRTLAAFAEGDLSARAPVGTSGDDLDALATQINTMAAQISVLIEQTRRLGANIAHDLRTPIARLTADLEAAYDAPAPQPHIERAEAEVARLSQVIDTLLRIARIEGGHGREGFAAVDLGEFAREMEENFGALAEDEGRAFVVDVSKPATVEADHGLLVQAMANLIQNALRYGEGTITLGAKGRTLSLKDEGKGVPEAYHAEIVKPLYRMDKARHSDGVGLGLAMVAAVAQRHGATLEFETTTQGFEAKILFPEPKK